MDQHRECLLTIADALEMQAESNLAMAKDLRLVAGRFEGSETPGASFSRIERLRRRSRTPPRPAPAGDNSAVAPRPGPPGAAGPGRLALARPCF